MKQDNLEDFFSGIVVKRYLGPFERWAAEDPARLEKLWAVLDECEKRGVSLVDAIARWKELYGELPVQRAQIHKRWRDRKVS